MLKLNCVRNEYLRARLYINEILHVELKDFLSRTSLIKSSSEELMIKRYSFK